jgi:hypothetical protein
MAKSNEIIAEWRDRIGTVPSAANDFVCSSCLGPVTGFPQCYGCHNLFGGVNGAPNQLRSFIVPMTSALSPSPWYTALATYKTFQPRNGLVLVSVAHHFLQTHASRVASLLGGEPTVVTVVPSKRGISYDDQPLRIALSKAEPIQEKLRETLRYGEGSTWGRQEYHPEAFTAGPVAVRGERVVLIEDTWVTGATAVSAAGRLLELGADGVALFPIARLVNANYWPGEHPYRQTMERVHIGSSLAIEWPR